MTTQPRPVFVNMTDRFMSGWGKAPGRSYYCVRCTDTKTFSARAIADAVLRAAHDRKEMQRVAISDKPRGRSGGSDHQQITDASSLGGPWLQYMPTEMVEELKA